MKATEGQRLSVLDFVPAMEAQRMFVPYPKYEAAASTQRLIETVLGRSLTADEAARLEGALHPAPSGHALHARTAPRWGDGTFMAYEDDREIEAEVALEEYERAAKGGRARATQALRAADGTFLPNSWSNGLDVPEKR